MTRDEAVAQIKVLMGFRADLTDAIKTQIGIQQRALEKEIMWRIRPWFLQTERIVDTLTIGGESFDRPADFISEIEEDGFWLVDAEGNEVLLTKWDEDDLRVLYGNDDDTQPGYYASGGPKFYIFPKADVAYSVKMRYYATDVAVSDSVTTNNWLTHAPSCIIGRVGLFLTGASQAKQRDMFSAIFLEAKQALEEYSMELLTVNRRYAMGETN